MAAIRNRVPYEVAVHAVDTATGKPVTNINYLRSDVQTVGAPAYGSPIAGPSSQATLLGNFQILWEGNIMARLSARYQLIDYTMQAIMGKQFPTPIQNIAALVPGTPVTITTGTPHGYVTGDSISVSGVTSPALANGVFLVTVLSTISFQLNGTSLLGAWSADGMVQKAEGVLRFAYADKMVLPATATGSAVGAEDLPLYCNWNLSRLNTGVGKNFKSRLSLAPVTEAENVNGRMSAAAGIAWGFVIAAYDAPMANGGTDATSGMSLHCALSHKLAIGLASPFTSSDSWCKDVVDFQIRNNFGSNIRRKSKSGAPII